MIKKIDKLVLGTFFSPFLISFTVLVFIFLMRFVLYYFDDIIGKGIGYDIIFKLLFYFSINTFTIAIPLSVLVASLMAFGRLGEFFELTALKSAGISIVRILRPIFVLVIFISIATYFFTDRIIPWANLQGWSLLYDVKTTKTTLNIKEGIFYNDLPGYSIKVAKKYPDQRSLKNLIIYNHTDNNANKRIILADSGQMYVILNNQYLVFELFNGTDYQEDLDKSSVTYTYQKNDNAVTRFTRSKMVISLKEFGMKKTEVSQFKHHQMMQTSKELSDTARAMRKEIAQINERLLETAEQYYFYHLKRLNEPQKKITFGPWVKTYLTKQNTSAIGVTNTLIRTKEQATTLLHFKENNVNSTDSKIEQLTVFTLELYKKYTAAFSCIVLFLIGGSLGAIVKKGGLGVPVIIAIICFIFMYLFQTNGEKLAKENLLNPFFGAWIANIILGLAGLYFLRKAIEDSRLFEADAYNIQLQKLKNWLINKGIIKYLPNMLGKFLEKY
jgi:lipopolysaccharide export system permease protein